MSSRLDSSVLPSQPMTVAQIVARAQDYDFNSAIQLRYWLRSASSMLYEANVYESESNISQAYLLLMRYANLVAEHLPTHPEAQTRDGKKSLKAASKELETVLDRLEHLKPYIEERYDIWFARIRSIESYTAADQDRRRNDISHVAEIDPATAGQISIPAADYGELAVTLGNSEVQRRNTLRSTSHRSSLFTEAQQRRRTAGIWKDWDRALREQKAIDDYDDLQRKMEDTRRLLDGVVVSVGSVAKPIQRTLTQLPFRSDRPTDNKLPTIQKSQPVNYDQHDRGLENFNSSNVSSSMPVVIGSAPQRPEKTLIATDYTSAPPRPSKEPSESHVTPMQTSYTFRPSAYLENGQPLRTVFLPERLRARFLNIADSNTHANLETCGLLCGTLISNALFVQKLVIPAQISTSDTCETTDESVLFDFCDKEDLIILGWIHTHPTQTCFMSSRDLHTHCGYQVMMPEAIAIVCAPSKDPS